VVVAGIALAMIAVFLALSESETLKSEAALLASMLGR